MLSGVTTESPDPKIDSAHQESQKPSSDSSAAEENSTAVIRLHNLPKNWLHEEIISFIDEVAHHAGIPEPVVPDSETQEGNGTSSESAIPQKTSHYVARVKVFFGRRTGLVYGSHLLTVRPAALAKYLVNDLQFEPHDFRSRMYFTMEESASTEGETAAQKTVTSFADVAESVDEEQEAALRTLELDRYLLAPDLLYDIAKMNQRRLLTSNEQIVIDSFLDSPEEVSSANGRSGRRGKGTRRRKTRKAKEQEDTGRGSLLNSRIPKPYVQGRSL